MSLCACGALFGALLLGLRPGLRVFSLGGGALALILALISGLLHVQALPALALAALLLWLNQHPATPTLMRRLCSPLLGLWALAAALHLLPGFDVLHWQDGFGRDARQVLRWQIDKGFAGLFLLWTLPARPPGRSTPGWWLLPGWALLLGLILASGSASFDPCWQTGASIWLIGNFFFTVIAEEVLFRGMIQGTLQAALATHRQGFAAAVGITALLFGAAHLAWGLPFALLATLAGVFYGLMAGHDKALSRAIAAHFGLNALILLLLHSPLG